MRARTTTLIIILALATHLVAAPKPAAPQWPIVDIPYEKFVLPNGLTVVVHEDHKAPIVAVNVWYHVGSKNEKPRKSGFAHLFEHLMFNGSENFREDYFQALEKWGATDLNGTTNNDRTNYFQNVPTSALDMVLWLESDRMGHLLGVVDQAKLDEQRGVVQNEKRQFDNTPYALSEELITKAIFPEEHPYGHTVIGSLEDLDAASLDDVKEWFRRYYGAANAVIVIAGDIDAKTAREKVEKYFGDIPAGPPVARFESWPIERTVSQRQTAQDRVPQARLYKVWSIPGLSAADTELLELVGDLLVSNDKTSRLYKRLVYDDQIATRVAAYVDAREIGSLFMIEADAQPGQDLTKVEKAVQEELARFLRDGPAPDELERAKAQYFARFTRGAERIGGFGGKSDILAASTIYLGSPDGYKRKLERLSAATAADFREVGRRWLASGDYTLHVNPFPDYSTSGGGADRSAMPEPGPAPAPEFPKLERATLANGLRLVVAERHAVPVVNFSLLVDSGWAADQFAQPGTTTLAMNMIDEGTKSRNSIDLSRDLSALGATLFGASNLDLAFVSLSALRSRLDPALAIYADVILNPSFPQADFDRLRRQQIAAIQNDQSDPFEMALGAVPRLVYGPDHAYGFSYRGRGDEATVAKIQRDDLARFHKTWFRPNNATLIVVGDTTLAEIRPKIEALFAGWAPGEVPKKNVGEVTPPSKPRVFLVDKPEAAQSVVMATVVGPPQANPQETAIEAMNSILGGLFISRINMNLREDKHWSYGAFSFLRNARGQRPFIAAAPVQTDKTKESVIELDRELREVLTGRPLTPGELDLAKKSLTLALPGVWETAEAVENSIAEIVRFGYADDHFATYAPRVRALTLEDMQAAARTVVKPGNLTWIIVGDLEKIEKGVRELNLGEVKVIDAGGKVLR